jgi:hypothetical protein
MKTKRVFCTLQGFRLTVGFYPITLKKKINRKWCTETTAKIYIPCSFFFFKKKEESSFKKWLWINRFLITGFPGNYNSVGGMSMAKGTCV